MVDHTHKLIPSTSPLRTAALAVIVVHALCQAWQPSAAVATEPSVRVLASDLVARLGHQEFAVRERSAAELIALEVDAKAALEVGAESQNREIRHRSAKLLALVSEIDLQRRFEHFKNATDPEQDYGLPGWDSYRKVAGDSVAARSIFVAMHEDESHLLRQIDDGPKRIADALANRCDQLRGRAMFESVQIRLGTIATLLFLATLDDVEISPLIPSVVYIACGGSTFKDAINSGPGREVLATLTERWIARQSLQGITYALHLGLSNNLKGTLSRAREVLETPVASASDRIYACLCLAKFGDESDFPKLNGYLENVNICAQDQVDGKIVVTEMRDLALATLVRIAKQEPKDFGFDRLVEDRELVFSLQSLGFRDEQSRVLAIASWREFERGKAGAEPSR
ncbi:MAG: hypothetical protein HYV60_11985 [Planctomycetia bacterium]|nr:hypothetical protein [Planctomycetia bacterium]